MKLEISLFGAFREFEPGAKVTLDVSDTAAVSDVRQALLAHARTHWPGFREGLLQRSAFASATSVLREDEAVPVGTTLTVLPPVGGG